MPHLASTAVGSHLVRRAALAAVVLAGTLAISSLPARATGASTGTITEFSSGITASSSPWAITTGPDGNLWFTEQSAGKIGRITPAGVVTEFAIPTASSNPVGITAGPDGNLWFTENATNKIGRITPLGLVTEFVIPTASSGPEGITAGPDGNLWFTEFNTNKIGRITTTGIITEFTSGITASSFPTGITAGPDGNLWFTEFQTNKIGRITPLGTVTEFAVTTPAANLDNIVTGPDGNLWFPENNTNKIGRITPLGVVTEFTTGISVGSSPSGLTVGADGNLWFTEYLGDRIGRITTTGVVSEFATGISASATPTGITAGPDGNLWFTESGVSKIGTLALANTGAQATSLTVTTGVLSISLAQNTVSFGTHTGGTSTSAIPTGAMTYTNTLGDGLAWSASVTGTDMISGANFLAVANISIGTSVLSAGTGGVGATPTNGAGGALSFTGCGSPGDLLHGISYSCPLGLMSATALTQGSWLQAGNNVTVTIPPGQAGGVYTGSLQYSVTG